MNNQRFQGRAGEDYELFKLACPHFDDLEKQVGVLIKEHFLHKGESVISCLELGVGPGYTTMYALELEDRVHVDAVDNEEVMLDQAWEVLSVHIKEKRVNLIKDDALSFLRNKTSNSYDVFFSGFTLHNFQEDYRESCLQEIYRILKKGGLFINADKYALSNQDEHLKSLEWQMQSFKDRYTEIDRLDLIQEWQNHYLQDNKDSVIMKEDVAMEQMTQAGFINIKSTNRTKMEMILSAHK